MGQESSSSADLGKFSEEEINNLLLEAADQGDLEAVQQLVNFGGANVNHKGNYGSSALHKASFKSHMDIVEFLVKNKAIVDIKDDMGSTPLHDACYIGNEQVVKYLVTVGSANVLDKNEDGDTPFMLAKRKQYMEICAFLEQISDNQIPASQENQPLLDNNNDTICLSFEHPSHQAMMQHNYELQIDSLTNQLKHYQIDLRHKCAQLAKGDEEALFLSRQIVNLREALRNAERKMHDVILLHETSNEALKNVTFDYLQLQEVHAALSQDYKQSLLQLQQQQQQHKHSHHLEHIRINLAEIVTISKGSNGGEPLVQEGYLGTGRYGTVWKAIWDERGGGTTVVVKLIPLVDEACKQEAFLTELNKEMEKICSLSHPRCLRIYGYGLDLVQNKVSLIMEHMENWVPLRSKLSCVEDKTVDNWSVKWEIAFQAAQALHYTHSKRLVHKQVCTHNFLIHKHQCTLTLCEPYLFSVGLFSKHQSEKKQWNAPETFQSGISSMASDVYSFGYCLWEIVTRKEVLCGLSDVQIVHVVCVAKERPDIPFDCDEHFSTLMHMCWQEDPQHRPSMKQVVEFIRKHKS